MQFIADIFPILGVSIIYHQDRNIIKPRANNQGIHSSFQDPAGSRPERVMQGTQFAPKAKSQKRNPTPGTPPWVPLFWGRSVCLKYAKGEKEGEREEEKKKKGGVLGVRVRSRMDLVGSTDDEDSELDTVSRLVVFAVSSFADPVADLAQKS